MKILIFLILSLFIRIFPVYSQADDIAIQINDLVVSKKEFDFLLHEYIKDYQKLNRHKPPVDTLQAWKENYLDNMLLIADASDRHLDNETIDLTVRIMSKYMITQPGSLFYKTKFNKITISNEELLFAYNKRALKYELEYFEFDTAKKLKEFILETGTDPFTDPAVKLALRQITLIWPVSKFAYDSIWDMKSDETSGPVNSKSGNYLIKVKRIIENNQQPFELEKLKIEKVLSMHYQISAYNDYKAQVLKNISYDSVEIERIWDDLKSEFLNQEKGYSSLASEYDRTLLKYCTNNKQLVSISTKDFLGYYRYIPLKLKLTTQQQFYDFLFSIVIVEELFKEADFLGFTRQNDFVFRKNRFRNKLILEEYIRKKIQPELVGIWDKELKRQKEREIRKALIQEARIKFKPIVCF